METIRKGNYKRLLKGKKIVDVSIHFLEGDNEQFDEVILYLEGDVKLRITVDSLELKLEDLLTTHIHPDNAKINLEGLKV